VGVAVDSDEEVTEVAAEVDALLESPTSVDDPESCDSESFLDEPPPNRTFNLSILKFLLAISQTRICDVPTNNALVLFNLTKRDSISDASKARL